MMTTVIYVCKDAPSAATAHDLLIQQGFAAANITVEQTETVIYNAETFAGGKADSLYDKVVVIGKR